MKEIKMSGGVAVVDDDMYDYLIQWKWYGRQDKKRNIMYAVRQRPEDGDNKTVYMHRLVLGVVDPKQHVDHINRDGMCNLRSNLRIANRSQNGANRVKRKNCSSKYMGVWREIKKTVNGDVCLWVAEISKNGKNKKIGRYKSEDEAALAYNEAATRLHGEFASLNIVVTI